MSAAADEIRGAAAASMDRGWSCFPVNGKIPSTEHGVLDATRDLDMIDAWWPEGTTHGLALATGAPSGVWVLDLDGPAAVDAFLELQQEHGTIRATVTSRTARGFHLFFRMPSEGDVRNSVSKVATGIDVRGTGGYVVLAPSSHPSGTTYQWARRRGPEEIAVAEAPDWLLPLVQRQNVPVPIAAPAPDRPRDARYVAAAIEDECLRVAYAPTGIRNERLNTAAFALARFVASGEARPGPMIEALRIAAEHAGLSREEAIRTIRSAFTARQVAA